MARLKGFKAVSVNNTYLEKEFKGHVKNLYYTPNGVDTKFFCPEEKSGENDKVLKIGWVGNKDRKAKNFPILRKLSKMDLGPLEFKIVGSRKKDKNLPKNRDQMRDFYRNLDFFLVTSSSEGTPNPGLEALSCGVPVISTQVGNMVELIQDGQNGFFVSPKAKSIANALKKALALSKDDLKTMSFNARQSIVDGQWDWEFKRVAWLKMFEDFRNG